MDYRLLVMPILLVMCWLSTSKAHPLERRQSTAPPSTGQSELRCRIDGTSDMYGLGIRLGIYLQTFAVLVAAAGKQTTSMEGISFAGCFFKLSMLSGLSILTLGTAEFNVVEAGIIIAFTICTHEAIHFQSKPKGGSAWELIRTGALPILIFSAQLGLGSYSIWFWFRG